MTIISLVLALGPAVILLMGLLKKQAVNSYVLALSVTVQTLALLLQYANIARYIGTFYPIWMLNVVLHAGMAAVIWMLAVKGLHRNLLLAGMALFIADILWGVLSDARLMDTIYYLTYDLAYVVLLAEAYISMTKSSVTVDTQS